MTTGLVIDSRYELHRTYPGHPERPERIAVLRKALADPALNKNLKYIEPQPAAEAVLLLNHSPALVARVKEASRTGAGFVDTEECSVSAESFDTALLAAGGVLTAVAEVAAGRLNNAFCAVRPPGHHAEYSSAMGFCFFNNIALAARSLLAQGLQRVLILDWDVHHGNGTQHAFEDDARVFFCSLHGHPAVLYPGSGYETERGVGNILNIPFRPGASDLDYRKGFEEKFLPAAADFDPQFILISAGFDAHSDDPLGCLQLTTDTYAWMTQKVIELAGRHCGGRVVSVLEGGYDLSALADSASAHVRELQGA